MCNGTKLLLLCVQKHVEFSSAKLLCLCLITSYLSYKKKVDMSKFIILVLLEAASYDICSTLMGQLCQSTTLAAYMEYEFVSKLPESKLCLNFYFEKL